VTGVEFKVKVKYFLWAGLIVLVLLGASFLAGRFLRSGGALENFSAFTAESERLGEYQRDAYERYRRLDVFYRGTREYFESERRRVNSERELLESERAAVERERRILESERRRLAEDRRKLESIRAGLGSQSDLFDDIDRLISAGLELLEPETETGED
jgi:hypothetical protein